MMKTLLALVALLFSVTAAVPQTALPYSYLSAASTNSTLVKAGRSTLRWIQAGCTGAAVQYLKIYEKATAPTCGTDVPRMRVTIQCVATTGGVPVDISGLDTAFGAGIGFCIVSGIADNSSANSIAGITLNLGVD